MQNLVFALFRLPKLSKIRFAALSEKYDYRAQQKKMAADLIERPVDFVNGAMTYSEHSQNRYIWEKIL